MKLSSRFVCITGASRGIGHAVALEVARLKNHLILVNRTKDQKLVDELLAVGALSVEIITADLTKPSDVTLVCHQLKSKQVDVLFNNAGLLTGGLIEEQDFSDIANMLQVNVNALIQLTQAVIPQMLKQGYGRIINHGSVSSIMHLPCASTYSAAKAAVWAFTDCIEQELKNTGVSTLCLFTPGIKTRMFDQIDEMYSKNVKVPTDSMPPAVYALKIIAAIESGQRTLKPEGTTGFGFQLAWHLRPLFNAITQKAFHR